MEATTQERENQAQLTQARLEDSQEKGGLIQGASPATFINIGEMVIVLGAAITVDIIDALDLTGVGAILVRFIDIPTLGAL